MSHEHEHNQHLHTHNETHEPLPCDGAGHHHHHHEDGSCCCEQHANEFHGIDKPMLARLIVAALLYIAARILPVGETAEWILLLLCALIAGIDIVYAACRNILRGRFFDEYFLMSLAAIAAFVIGEYEEGAAVFLLYRIGAFCQSYAIQHSRRTIAELTGDEDILEDGEKTSNPFITRFSRVYTPVILIVAVCMLLYFPLIEKTSWHDAIYRALPFLVLACPCAIVISVPMAYFAGIGAASKKGVLFQNSEAVDALAKAGAAPEDGEPSTFLGHTASVFRFSSRQGRESRMVLTDPDRLVLAKKAAAKTRRVAMENVVFTLFVKLLVLILSVCGISALWLAVFADSGITVLVVLNSLRAFRIK